MVLSCLDSNTLKSLDAIAEMIGLSSSMLIERVGFEFSLLLEKEISLKDKILFLVGPKNNGSDGLATVRNLKNRGFNVSVLLSSKRNDYLIKILDHMAVPLFFFDDFKDSNSKLNSLKNDFDVFVDCLLGTGQVMSPNGNVLSIVDSFSSFATKKTLFSCDVPTGINDTTGEIFPSHFSPDKTFSFVAPKKCFEIVDKPIRGVFGTILIVGIGIPAELYAQVGVSKESCLVDGVVEFNQ